MTKNSLIAFLSISIILASSFFFTQFQKSKKSESAATPKSTVTINDTKVVVDIPISEEEKRLGLGGVEDLKPTEGMLFDYVGDPGPQVIWMKGMVIPIDIIWIKNDKVVTIHENVAPPNTESERLKLYVPSERSDYALEVSGGFSKNNNIKIGDQVIIAK